MKIIKQVVINRCCGSVSQILSEYGWTEYLKVKGLSADGWALGYPIVNNVWLDEPKRTDPALIDVVARLGAAASACGSNLQVVDIVVEDVTDEVIVENHDGREYVSTTSGHYHEFHMV